MIFRCLSVDITDVFQVEIRSQSPHIMAIRKRCQQTSCKIKTLKSLTMNYGPNHFPVTIRWYLTIGYHDAKARKCGLIGGQLTHLSLPSVTRKQDWLSFWTSRDSLNIRSWELTIFQVLVLTSSRVKLLLLQNHQAETIIYRLQYRKAPFPTN